MNMRPLRIMFSSAVSQVFFWNVQIIPFPRDWMISPKSKERPILHPAREFTARPRPCVRGIHRGALRETRRRGTRACSPLRTGPIGPLARGGGEGPDFTTGARAHDQPEAHPQVSCLGVQGLATVESPSGTCGVGALS